MYVRIYYNNGYCGCEETEVAEVENMDEAEEIAEENLYDYAENYVLSVTRWDEDFESEEEEEEYYNNCTYDIEEITREEYLDEL